MFQPECYGQESREYPTILRFYGILIRMIYRDHAPPHFHAVYGDQELTVGISPIVILQGSAPSRVRSMVMEWAAIHQQELLSDWDACRRGSEPAKIAPLE